MLERYTSGLSSGEASLIAIKFNMSNDAMHATHIVPVRTELPVLRDTLDTEYVAYWITRSISIDPTLTTFTEQYRED